MSAALRLPLEQDKDTRFSNIRWKQSAPFVINERAMLVHRPRMVTVYNAYPDGRPHKVHIAVWYYCGNTAIGPKDLTFAEILPDDAIVCHRCELIAVAKELPPSSVLLGRHVHIGGVKAYKICCPDDSAQLTYPEMPT